MGNAPQQWWLICGVRRGSAVGSCSLPSFDSGGPDRADPHTDGSLHCAHTLVEVAGPPLCGGGTTANVGEATCAMGWPHCRGSETKKGRTRMQRGAIFHHGQLKNRSFRNVFSFYIVLTQNDHPRYVKHFLRPYSRVFHPIWVLGATGGGGGSQGIAYAVFHPGQLKKSMQFFIRGSSKIEVSETYPK